MEIMVERQKNRRKLNHAERFREKLAAAPPLETASAQCLG